MTFVGKIFTVVILIFSVVMMSLALMVGAAHKNWLEVVNGTKDKPATGLVAQLADAKKENARLENDNNNLRRAIAAERTASKVELARSEAALQTQMTQFTAQSEQLKKEVETLGKSNLTLASAEEALKAKQQETEKLRDEIRVAQADRDKTLDQVVAASDKNHILSIQLANLARRGVELSGQIASFRKLIEAYNIDPNKDPSGIPPPVDAIVKEVRNNGQDVNVLLSLGSDAGLREGHEMNVYRGDNLIGRVRLIRVDSDNSVGKSNPTYYKRPFQEGDEARTIVPVAQSDRQANRRK
jgi:hypothetical protein